MARKHRYNSRKNRKSSSSSRGGGPMQMNGYVPGISSRDSMHMTIPGTNQRYSATEGVVADPHKGKILRY